MTPNSDFSSFRCLFLRGFSIQLRVWKSRPIEWRLFVLNGLLDLWGTRVGVDLLCKHSTRQLWCRFQSLYFIQMFIISSVAAKLQVTLQRPSCCKNQNNEWPLSFFFFSFHPPCVCFLRPVKQCCAASSVTIWLYFILWEGGGAMNLCGAMVMNVCVFSMVRLWPSSACHRLYTRWSSLQIHFRWRRRTLFFLFVFLGDGRERRSSFSKY